MQTPAHAVPVDGQTLDAFSIGAPNTPAKSERSAKLECISAANVAVSKSRHWRWHRAARARLVPSVAVVIEAACR